MDIKNIHNYTQEELEDILDNASKIYYLGSDDDNNKESPLSDEMFDFLKQYVISHFPSSKYKDNIGTDNIQGKVDLPVHMGSMTNKKNEDQISKWVIKYNDPIDHVIMSKLDGISGLLEKNGPMIKLFTRGNGKQGKDITGLLEYIKIPDLSSYTNITVRGELLIKLDTYNKLKGEKGANSRSFVSGVVNSKKPDKTKAKLLDFVAYELIHPQCKISDQLKKMAKLGFNVVKNLRIVEKNKMPINFSTLEELLVKFKKESIYLIDGIIIRHNKNYMVNTSGNPDYAFAFKMVLEEQIKEAKIVKVHWNVSKFGVLFPQIEIEPVNIAGNNIRYISGKSAKFIYDNKLGKGSIINVIRTCDVIPDVHEIIKSSKSPDMPDMKYKWNDSKVNIMLEDISDNKEMNIKKIVDFFKTINVGNLGMGIVTTLYDNGYDSIKKVINIKYDDLLKIKGFKATISNKIINNIKTGLEKMTLIDLMNASNVFGKGFGDKNLTLLYSEIPDILELKNNKDLYNKINNIKGFSDTKTKQFLENLDMFKKFLKELKLDTHNLRQYNKKVKNSKNVVLTGFRDTSLTKILDKRNIDVSDDINDNTIFVVTKDINKKSKKIEKAENKNIKILSLEEFLNYLKSH